MTLLTRLKVLEQQVLPTPIAPEHDPFDHDAYRESWIEASRLPPEELARECAGILAAAAWPEPPPGRGPFDWAAYTRLFYGDLAGNPPNWHELVEEAGR